MNFHSSRRQEIEAHKPQNAKEAQVIAHQTRQEKQELPPRSELFAKWQEIGREYGFGMEQAKQLTRNPLEPLTLTQKIREWRIVREAATKVTRSESHFARRDLVRFIAEASQTRQIDAKRVYYLTEKYLSSRQIMNLGRVNGEERFTTKRLWKLERQILTQAKTLEADRSRFRVSSHKLDSIATRHHLNEGQQKALGELTRPGRLKVLTGLSGTGKTHTLGAAREAFEKSGYQVVGITLSKRGAERLQEQTGIGQQSLVSQALFGKKQQAMTLSRLFWEIERAKKSQRQYGSRSIFTSPLSRQTILIADNAQDLSAVQMKRLVTEIKQSGAKLILSGDLKRSAAYDHGGALRAIAQNLKPSELTQIQRQINQPERDILHYIDRGQALIALKTLNAQGKLSISERPEQAAQKLIATWSKQGSKRPRDHLILTEDREERNILNRLAQAERRGKGDIKGAGVSIGNLKIYKGERIHLTETSHTYGVTKGTFGEVRHLDRVTKVAAVRLDNGKHKLINLRHYKGVDLGYCLTGNQAREVETRCAYVISHGVYERQGVLQQLSRAKQETYLYTYQVQEEKEQMVDLARKIDRENYRDFAHSLERETESREY